MSMYSFSFLAPLYSPRPFPAPPGGKEEPTATFGHVFKAKTYSLEMHVDINDPPTLTLLAFLITAGETEFKLQISKFFWLFNVLEREYFLCL